MKRFILLLCILAMSLLYAQTTLSVSPHVQTYNEFYPAQFNPDEPLSQPIFFTLTISGVVEDVKTVRFEMNWNDNYALANITTEGEDVPFPAMLTNQDFINSDPIGLDIDNADAFDDILDAIEDYILETGRIPDGTYLFTFTALDEDGNALSSDQMQLIIQAPIAIGLITPGGPIGLPPVDITFQTPDFIWYSNLSDYTFSIFDISELDEDQRTPDNIEVLQPYYEQTNVFGTSLAYPPEAPALEVDKIYAWRVAASISIPIGSGTEPYKSGFYVFRIVTEGGVDPGEVILGNFLNNVSGEQAAAILELLNNGYELQEIEWQGETISVEELMEILQMIINGELEVIVGP
ncbi:MAG: hypothetical protein DRI23_12265 [Candidatus Cloacimonadota bacterium]|nr:MAG: hypothetical protein DRI23_12265 [Candidatus Cloacimonadota bacterium]